MDAEFWHQRWQTARIGFHREQINAQLTQEWPTLALAKPSQVLVPLCGKSKDMLWLAERGHKVSGFELSPLAVADFFAEANLTPTQTAVGPYQCWQAEQLHIYQGDFFQIDKFQAHHLGQQFDAGYDRAALIALPKEMRAQYVELLARLLKPGASLLLITVHYAPEQQQAPPFSIDEQAVFALFTPYFTVALRSKMKEGHANPRVASGELSFFDELCFVLVRNSEE
ncbi:thiopurine S-methyltransferase [Oceanisphaera sp. W20_SRM_FM3]|uniref:thiopurine S-methyltransferase n=1 Tax=Oceanisphaera sp. W20_SRM_FM3 TaxID=3240267 RepID=UPI003F9CC11C